MTGFKKLLLTASPRGFRTASYEMSQSLGPLRFGECAVQTSEEEVCVNLMSVHNIPSSIPDDVHQHKSWSFKRISAHV